MISSRKKEGEGPLGKMFDMVESEDLFGEDTWEAAESTMQKKRFWRWGGKSIWSLQTSDISLAETCCARIATSIGVEGLGIPMFGLFGACSTAGELWHSHL